MTLWSRIRLLFDSKAHAALDRVEEPTESLEVAYRTQVAAHEEARRGVADVLTSEKRLEIEAQALAAAAERAIAAARDAARAGDDGRARAQLEREAFITSQRERLFDEIADVRAQRIALEEMTEALRRRVELLRTEKLALGARYATAKATVRAGESVTGLSEHMADVARMVERARDKSRDVQARAAALTELAGTTNPGSSGNAEAARIDARLAALKTETLPELTDS